MGERLYALDNVILAFFTRISHAFQRLTGRTNFFLAMLAIIVMSISCIVAICDYWVPVLRNHHSNSFDVAINGFVLLTFVWHFQFCKMAEERAFSGDQTLLPWRPFASIEKMGLSGFLRVFSISSASIVTALFMAYELRYPVEELFLFRFLYYMFLPALSMYLYLIAVHPMPPGKSKVQEWIESIAAGFRQPVETKAR